MTPRVLLPQTAPGGPASRIFARTRGLSPFVVVTGKFGRERCAGENAIGTRL